MGDLPKKCCLKCHFLLVVSKLDGIGDSSEEHVLPADREQREKLAAGTVPKEDAQFLFPQNILCHKEVWDGANFKTDEDILGIVRKPRLYKVEPCFFYPYNPGMPLPVAEELERRATDRREAKMDRYLTNQSLRQSRRAFRVAFAALIASILLSAATLIWNIWQHFHPFKP